MMMKGKFEPEFEGVITHEFRSHAAFKNAKKMRFNSCCEFEEKVCLDVNFQELNF